MAVDDEGPPDFILQYPGRLDIQSKLAIEGEMSRRFKGKRFLVLEEGMTLAAVPNTPTMAELAETAQEAIEASLAYRGVLSELGALYGMESDTVGLDANLTTLKEKVAQEHSDLITLRVAVAELLHDMKVNDSVPGGVSVMMTPKAATVRTVLNLLKPVEDRS